MYRATECEAPTRSHGRGMIRNRLTLSLSTCQQHADLISECKATVLHIDGPPRGSTLPFSPGAVDMQLMHADLKVKMHKVLRKQIRTMCSGQYLQALQYADYRW